MKLTRASLRPTSRRPRRPATPARPAAAPPVQLTWSHLGVLFRVTAWPEARFEYLDHTTWVGWEPNPSTAAFATAAAMLGRGDWQRYLEFVPAAERAFIERFDHERLSALVIASRCPELIAELEETPALVPFIAAHLELRGGDAPRWRELAAEHAHGGIYALLAWLGLPAERRTLALLGNIADPDLPRSLLVPLRSALWTPAAAWALTAGAPLQARDLRDRCQALAA